MATPVKKWLLRVAPWFLPVGIVAVWQLASSVGWLSTRILPSPEGVVCQFRHWLSGDECAGVFANGRGGSRYYSLRPARQTC